MRKWVKIEWIKEELQEGIIDNDDYDADCILKGILSKVIDIENEDQEWDIEGE